MPELMNHVEFRTALENAIKGKSANKAPFSIAWASGKLSRAHLARWAENHYHYVGPFADYLAYIYARMPEHYTEAKDFLLANMYEEEIGGDRHTDLLIRFAEACGTTRERVKDPDNMTATTRGLQSWCYSVAMREDPIVAVAGLVVGLESQVPSIYRKQTPTLREKYKFTDEEVEFFDLHIVSDEIHGERGYQIVLEHANTVELQQRCLKICEVGAQMRLLYTTALYQDYVAQGHSAVANSKPLESKVPEDERNCCRRDQVPTVILHRDGQTYQGEVEENTNLVVRAGYQAISLSTSALRMRDGKMRKVRLPCSQGRRASPAAELEGKETARSQARRGLPPGLPALAQSRCRAGSGQQPDRAPGVRCSVISRRWLRGGETISHRGDSHVCHPDQQAWTIQNRSCRGPSAAGSIRLLVLRAYQGALRDRRTA